MERKQRQTNFELLRLVSMLLIVLGHSILHGLRQVTSTTIPDIGIDANSGIDMFNFTTAQILCYMANIGVNLFVLITGYFIVSPKEFHKVLGKSFRLWRTMVFYCLDILVIAFLFGYRPWTFTEMITAVTPIYHNTYWFMTQYIALFLLSPFLARLLSNLTKKEYVILLAVLLVFNFQQESIGYGKLFSSGMGLLFFIFLFCIGGYIRRFNPFERWQKYGLLFYLAVCLLMALMGVFLQMRHLGSSGHEYLYIKGLANNSIPLFTSVALFLWFKTIDIRNNKVNRFILMCSPYVLGVYLIHDNPIVREWLWGSIKDYIHAPWFIPGLILYVMIVFASCLIIDSCRAFLLARYYKMKNKDSESEK